MLLRILMVLLLSSISMPAMSAELDNSACHSDNTYLDIYTRAIRQVFEIMVSAEKIAKNDVEMITIEPDRIITTFNNEFDTKFFSKTCFVTGKIYTYRYDASSFMGFGIYQLTFSNRKDLEHAAEILKNLKRDHFRTNKIPTQFTWHKGSNSIFIIVETLFGKMGSLEQLIAK